MIEKLICAFCKNEITSLEKIHVFVIKWNEKLRYFHNSCTSGLMMEFLQHRLDTFGED